PTTLVYGGQVRGYGLGALAIAWSMAALWSFVSRPSAARAAVAQAPPILAAQSHFGNRFLVAAFRAAGAAVAFRRKETQLVFAVGALGAVAALSMAINLPSVLYAMRLSPIEQGNWSVGWLASVFTGALAPEIALLRAAWLVAALAAA